MLKTPAGRPDDTADDIKLKSVRRMSLGYCGSFSISYFPGFGSKEERSSQIFEVLDLKIDLNSQIASSSVKNGVLWY